MAYDSPSPIWYLRDAMALRSPRRVCNPTWHLKTGRLAGPQHRHQEGRTVNSGIQMYPFLFRVHPKATRDRCPEKAASPPSHQGGRAPRPAGPTQTSSFRVCWTSRPQTRQPVFLHLGLLNSLQPRTSPGRLCSRLLFPLCGAFTSSAVGLLISLRSSLSSPPNTCILQAALECWPRGNNGRLWRRLRPGPSQYLLQCEATVLKSLPSRTQQRGVPRGFEILF